MAKRAFDFVVALVALIACAPVILIVSGAILITMGSPVLYRQTRPGLSGKSFEVIKFRTMSKGSAIDADRLTRLGNFLRRFSLDELPELINVIRGDMSLVGPRPLLVEYLPLYTGEQNRRHEARPGITGWAQVNGRNKLAWEKKFELDVWYVDHRSFWLDLKILWMTVLRVLRAEGINQPGSATAERFRGSNT